MARDAVDAQRAAQERAAKQELNQQLASMAVRNAVTDQSVQREYPVGPGDVLDVSVFDVPELNKTVRVNGNGAIMLPLIGELHVRDKSLKEVEALIARELNEFMHEPQVSVFVSEYQSQQVSVTGAVNRPALHTLSRPRTVLELLSLSGGLSSNAGNQIYVQTTVKNQPQRLIIDLRQILSDPDSQGFSLVLKGGDSIFVPEAGTVFVEGAVKKPGAYSLAGGSGLVEAITMAGGTTGVARTSDVQVVTMGAGGEREVVSVNLEEIRENPGLNVELRDGDIVHVPTSGTKTALSNTWEGIKGIFNVGIGASVNLLGP